MHLSVTLKPVLFQELAETSYTNDLDAKRVIRQSNKAPVNAWICGMNEKCAGKPRQGNAYLKTEKHHPTLFSLFRNKVIIFTSH